MTTDQDILDQNARYIRDNVHLRDMLQQCIGQTIQGIVVRRDKRGESMLLISLSNTTLAFDFGTDEPYVTLDRDTGSDDYEEEYIRSPEYNEFLGSSNDTPIILGTPRSLY